MGQQDAFDRALAGLHEAALDDARWPAMSPLLEEACGTSGSGVTVAGGFGDDRKIHFAMRSLGGRDIEEVAREYFKSYHFRDERLPRLRALPDGKLARVTDLYTEAELKVSPAYNEALRDSCAQNALNVRLAGPGGSRIIWVFADPVKDGNWGSDQVDMIEALLPHLRQYVRVRQTLATADALGASVMELLDADGVGVVWLNESGRILDVNDRALSILRRADGLQDRRGFLQALEPADDPGFQRLLAGALPVQGSQPTGGSMTVGRSSGSPRLVVHVNPVPAPEMAYGTQHLAALVLTGEPGGHEPHLDHWLVAKALGLTRREGLIAVALARGNEVSDIASAMGRSEFTVRWHIKKILRKQGVTRRADLIRLVLSTSGFAGPVK